MVAQRTHRSGDRNGTPAAAAPGVEATSGVETVAIPPVVAARCRGGVITAPAAADVSTAGDDVMDDDDDAALPSAISCTTHYEIQSSGMYCQLLTRMLPRSLRQGAFLSFDH